MPELSRAEFFKLNQARRAGYMFRQGVRTGFEGSLFAVPIAAASMAAARRGEALATGSGVTASMVTFPFLQGTAASLISLIPGVGPSAALFLSMFAAAYPSSLVDNFVSRSVRTFSQAGRNVRRLETGMDFQDSEFAALRRANAQMELSAAIQSSRRYLGQEARFLHR